jgi:hypothetical protein
VKITTGSVYEVNHRNKGKFVLAVRFSDKNFTTGMVLDGKVEAYKEESEISSGDEVTVRNSFCEFKLMQVSKGALL